MADYDALYEMYGLSGIAPHAFLRESSGYRYLVERIEKGSSLFVVISEATHAPFLSVCGGAVCAYAFTEEALSGTFLVEQIANGYKVAIRRTESRGFLESMISFGVQLLVLNNEVKVAVSDIAKGERYFGDESEEPPKNTQANAALCLAMQEQVLEESQNSYFALLFCLLRDATVLVPVIGQGQKGSVTSLADLQTPIFRDASGMPILCAFLDVDSLDRFWRMGESAHEKMPQKLYYEMGYTALRTLFFANPKVRLAFNPAAGIPAIDHELFRALELRADLLQGQDGLADAGEEDDPVPEFLR